MERQRDYPDTESPRDAVAIQSERQLSIGFAQIARVEISRLTDHVVPSSDVYRLDMALAPRPTNARGNYSRHWGFDRYEKLGTLWMVPPGEPMRFRSEPGTTRCVHCSLKPEAVAEWLGDESGWRAPALDGALDVRGGRIHTLLLHLAAELQEPGFAGEAMVELICSQIAIEISRYWRTATAETTAAGLAPWRLRAIEERLLAGGPMPTLAELGAICGLSVRHLTRGYRRSRGRSIGEAIANGQVAQAKTLLSSDRSAKVISHMLGFASPASFSCAFRNATGQTPREYRTALVREARPQ